MRIGYHEYANEADDDDDDVPKPAQSLGTPVPRQKVHYINQKNPKLNVTIKTFIDNKNHSFVQLYHLLKVHVQYMYKLYDIHTQI